MKESVIMFMSPGCGACQSQKQALNDYFISQGKTHKLDIVNVDKYPNKFKYIDVLPTWMFILPGGKTCVMKTGVLPPQEIFGGSPVKFGRKRSSMFGKTLYPGINDRDYYGKDFPNGKGFNIPDSYYQQVESVWGKGDDTLNAGVGGSRSLGPDKVTEMYNSGYVNNIRMAHPSDQLGTALYLNRLCNTPKTGSVGMVSGSNNSPQIVDMTTGAFGRRRRARFGDNYYLNANLAAGTSSSAPKNSIGRARKARFGKNYYVSGTISAGSSSSAPKSSSIGRPRKARFGNLYSQMGPAFEIGNQYLINKNTGNELYSGARQFESPRPDGTGGDLFISKAPKYKPLSKFGKRKVKPTMKKPVKDKKMDKKKMDKKKGKKLIKKKFDVSGRKAVNIKININSKKSKE